MITQNFTEYFQCVKQYAKCFTYFDSFNPNNIPMSYVSYSYSNFTNNGEKSNQLSNYPMSDS